jgi:spermidine/putrescine transport system ATP-binding protein
MVGRGPDAARGEGQGDLRLAQVTKQFGSFVAVDDIDLDVPEGSFFALLGPSGCGKTTTLRMIAGLEQPTEGRILLGGKDVSGTKPYQRPVNTVFQNYALFPHLDVFENVAFGLRRRGAKDVKRQVDEALELVQLGHLARRRPAQLSGGQQQRIALARAVVNRPQVLLLDEPLGALDLKLRKQMQIELKRIQTEVGLTFVHVTHDQEEAMTMADTIAVMNAGKVEQLGSPAELYESPRTTFVANFLGQSNLVEGTVSARNGSYVVVDVRGTKVFLPAERVTAAAATLLVGVRPEKIAVLEETTPVPDGFNALSGGIVSDASFMGVSTQYLVTLPWGQDLTVFSQNLNVGGLLPVGARVTLAWAPQHTFGLAGDAEAGIVLDEMPVRLSAG